MKYLQFQRNLNETLFDINIQQQYQMGPYIIKETEDKFLIDLHEFNSLNEAIDFIKNQKYSKLVSELSSDISNYTLTSLIKEQYPDIKITNSTLNSIRSLIETRSFAFNTILESVQSHSTFSNKLYFVLEDSSKVLIDKETFRLLNNVFENQTDIESYMKANKENFMNVVNQLEGTIHG